MSAKVVLVIQMQLVLTLLEVIIVPAIEDLLAMDLIVLTLMSVQMVPTYVNVKQPAIIPLGGTPVPVIQVLMD